MITGCNTNILYRGRQFHVQTEDSGRANPHIISHVYHGGTIIASQKSEYGDRIDADELDIKVRAQIEVQHKAMLERLTTGELDDVINERLGVAPDADKPAPPTAKAPAAERAESDASGDTSGSVTAGAESTGSVTAGAVTDPSIDAERPPADTKPIIDKSSTPGFGDSLDTEKPLDEVILEYLVDKARDRAADKQQAHARKQRKKG